MSELTNSLNADTDTEQESKVAPGTYAPCEGPPDGWVECDEDVQNSLRSLVKTMPGGRDLYDRRFEVREARRQRYFYRNMQNIAWNEDNQTWVMPSGGFTNNARDLDDDWRKTFNIYLGYAKSFMSVLSQNAPNVRFEPENPKNSHDIDAAAEANKMVGVIEKFNPPKELQIKVARLLWTDGRVLFHTRWVVDGQRFGFDNEGNPRGREVIDAYGVLEAKVPISINGFNNLPWAQISEEYDITTLQEMFPDAASKIVPGSSAGETEYDRIARLAVMQGTELLAQGSDAINYMATLEKTWFRPSAYRAIADENQRNKLYELFPDGVQVTFAGGAFCCAINESMDDHTTILHAVPGDGQNRPSIGRPMVEIQESFNDCMNITMDTYERCIPATWVDQDAIDIDGVLEQSSQPGNYHPIERQDKNQPISASFFQEEPAEPSPSMPPFMEALQGPLAQFITGQQPALFGGEMEDQKTARGYQMARDQALGMMGLIWMPFTHAYSQVMLQAVKTAATCRSESLEVNVPVKGKRGETEVVSIDVDKLSGDVLCFPETDENFPESWTQKKNAMMMLLQQASNNPVIAAALQQPDNLALIRDAIGLEDLVIPGAESRDKQLKEISVLLASAPQPNPAFIQQQKAQQVAQATGAQIPPTPPVPQFISSVPIDSIFDDNNVEYEECVRWINSREGQAARVSQPEGFANVRLHALEHKAQVDQAKQQSQQEMLMAVKAKQNNSPTETLPFRDLPPSGQIQLAAKAGIHLGPQDVSVLPTPQTPQAQFGVQ